MDEVVVASYLIESFLPIRKAAEALANEQSTGTFVPLANETHALRQSFAARVLDVQSLPPGDRPPLPGAGYSTSPTDRPSRGIVRIAFPLHNFGPSLPNLLAAVAGNLFELRELAAVRLLDLDLPSAFAERYPGPQFGISGTRQLMGRASGVLLGTIIKPSIGLPLDRLRAVVRELALADIDFIKDDELTANPPHAPFAARVAAVSEELDRVAQHTGRKAMYAFNITDDIDRLVANHDLVANSGGTAVMVCVNLIGLAGLAHLRRHSELPIHGHRAMVGLYTRDPQLGIDFVAFQKLARLAGVDHLHTNGIGNKFYESDQDVMTSIQAVQQPLWGGYFTLPVLSSGQVPGLAPQTFELLGTTDLLILAGGGIHGHPDGPAAGVEAMREAWSCAIRGSDLAEAAVQNGPLRRSLDTFGYGSRG
ncbi:RuBisCO large subunit C-terminal-like domain-containing protein [Actinopolymorpha sp. B11F2]|uniref:RuBisCO large subunit C-terminal-like domain-containing protein n=1 Tax=Actinopolymorpha sp. B11F2 TaxID=3160862 RepID=UPI0032E41320